MNLNLLSVLTFAVVASCQAAASNKDFRPGEIWLDVDGRPIQAHGGGILLHSNVYYWHGEDRTPRGPGAVSCYSSTNLLDWKREGVALAKDDVQGAGFGRAFIERPKVIYNPSTKKFVMWSHMEQNGYRFARAGVAISDSPVGPFQFLKAIRPIANTNQFEGKREDPLQEKQFGGTYRDMNLFVDDDGRAYSFYAAEDNLTMYVTRLNKDFTGPEEPAVAGQTWARILVQKHREAPAPFKWRGRYFIITSGCTGWAPNAADLAVSDHVLGPYRMLGNPFTGPGADKTFDSQSTFVLKVPGRENDFIYLGDRWKPQDLPDSRYIWLPFTMGNEGSTVINWRDRWNFSTLDEVKTRP